MVFSSIEFVFFFLAAVVAFVLVREKYRWIVLLVVSFLFYAALNAFYLVAVLAVISLITYLFGNWIGGIHDERKKRSVLWTAVLLVLAIFAGMRYFSFFYHLLDVSKGASVESAIVSTPIILTIGISFIAFQAISYLVDVYRGACAVERHVGYLALYLAYFPKLLQGPLERAGAILPQLRQAHINNYDNVRSAFVLFGWGLCKKVIIADRMAGIVNPVFDNVRYYHGVSLIVAVYAFAIQIYADFSGYTDMAIALSRIFGISLTENFRHPYLSTSFEEFWRRWHISFMNWLRDYVFMPLQIAWRDAKTLGTIGAIFIVFAVSGIWHGGGLNYIVWGLLNGLFLAAGLVLEKWRGRLGWKKHDGGISSILKIIVVFNLTCVTWIFFRSGSVGNALYLLGHITEGVQSQLATVNGFERAILIGMKRTQAVLTWLLILVFIIVEIVLYRKGCKFDELITKVYSRMRWPVYFGLIAAIILLSYEQTGSFIYFNF